MIFEFPGTRVVQAKRRHEEEFSGFCGEEGGCVVRLFEKKRNYKECLNDETLQIVSSAELPCGFPLGSLPIGTTYILGYTAADEPEIGQCDFVVPVLDISLEDWRTLWLYNECPMCPHR